MQRLYNILIIIPALWAIDSWSSDSAGDLNWLLGCWESTDGSSREVWVRQSDEQLIGFSVALAQGQVVFYETLSIGIDDDGNAHYTAHPEGQPATVFSAETQRGNEIEFINPQHDFPQKISYRPEGDQLLASISLLDGGNSILFDKVRCQQTQQ
jgi:hypothetical protein